MLTLSRLDLTWLTLEIGKVSKVKSSRDKVSTLVTRGLCSPYLVQPARKVILRSKCATFLSHDCMGMRMGEMSLSNKALGFVTQPYGGILRSKPNIKKKLSHSLISSTQEYPVSKGRDGSCRSTVTQRCPRKEGTSRARPRHATPLAPSSSQF